MRCTPPACNGSFMRCATFKEQEQQRQGTFTQITCLLQRTWLSFKHGRNKYLWVRSASVLLHPNFCSPSPPLLFSHQFLLGPWLTYKTEGAHSWVHKTLFHARKGSGVLARYPAVVSIWQETRLAMPSVSLPPSLPSSLLIFFIASTHIFSSSEKTSRDLRLS